MAGFDDFIRQRMANTTRGYTTDPNGTPVMPPQVQPITTIPNQPTPMPMPTPMSAPMGGPVTASPQDGVDQLIKETLWEQMYPGLSTRMNPEQMPSPPVAGAMAGVNPIPNPTIPHVPVNTYGPPQAPSNPQSGLDALIANAKQGGGQVSPQRGPMNPIQQAAAVALMKMKGMK